MGFDLALFNKVSSADIGSKAASQSRREKKENAWAQIETRAAEIKEKFEQEAADAEQTKMKRRESKTSANTKKGK